MSIDAQVFAQAGEAMFGEEWKSPMADLLGMDVRTVRRIAKAAWEGAEYPINPTLGPVLAQHLTSFVAEMGPRLATAQGLIDRLNGH